MTFKALIANKTGDKISTDVIDMRSLTQSGARALALAAALSSSTAWAAGPSPFDLWKNIDDATGKPRSLLRITESNMRAVESSTR